MWCKLCQQDVPGIVSRDDGKLYCTRCNGMLQEGAAGQVAAGASEPCAQTHGLQEAEQPLEGTAPLAGPYDRWELDEELRHIDRVLSSNTAQGGHQQQAGRREQARLDPAHHGPANWHPSLARKPQPSRRRSTRSGDAWVVAPTWAALALGIMLLPCGGILLGWSVLSGRQELWSIGLPIALVGQMALLVGLLLQLDRLWHHNRHTAAKLDNVHAQLHDLKAAATMLGTSHSSAASTFYSHLAGGASPQLLLADLKSQLDLLAVRIGDLNQ